MTDLPYFVLLIGVLIFVHETGHFLFAKLFDVKVLKFSLGFGPRMLGFRRGETDYVVAWLPLGGFVKMLGEDPNDEIKPEDQGRAFNQKPLWQRYIIVLAGPAFNLIFPIFVLFFWVVATHTQQAPAMLGKVFPGDPAAAAGLRPGDRVVAVDGDPIRYWEDLVAHIEDSPGKPLRLSIERDGQRFERLVTPHEQVERDHLNLEQRVGRIGIGNRFELAQVGISDAASPAARAGLQTGDLVTSVNGITVERWPQLEKVLRENRGHSLRISYLRPGPLASPLLKLRVLSPAATVVDPEPRRAEGKTVYEAGIYSAEFFVRTVDKGSPADQIGMRPGDRVTAFNGQPLRNWETIILTLEAKKSATHTISWMPYGGSPRTRSFKLAHVTYLDDYSQEQQRYVFGAYNRLLWRAPDPIPIDGRVSYAITRALRQTGEIARVTFLAVVQAIRGAIPRDSIGGPLMILKASGVAARKGWDHFLWLLTLISINLGILNLLPIPILDGGHIMFFTIEAVKRRPLSLRAREIASYVGLVLLISLLVYACRNDIVRYTNWFK